MLTIEDRAKRLGELHGFPWVLLITVAIEIISECIEDRSEFVSLRQGVPAFMRIALGWRLRRIAREEGARVKGITRLADDLAEELEGMSDDEVAETFDYLALIRDGGTCC